MRWEHLPRRLDRRGTPGMVGDWVRAGPLRAPDGLPGIGLGFAAYLGGIDARAEVPPTVLIAARLTRDSRRMVQHKC